MKTKIKEETVSAEEKYYTASQWQLMWRKFKKHKLAIFGMIVLVVFYVLAMCCEFFSPYNIYERRRGFVYSQPQKLHFVDQEGNFHLRPFVYKLKRSIDPVTWGNVYEEDTSKMYPIQFFVRGDKYKLIGFIPSDLHFFGVEEGATVFLFGTDGLGRDFFSRTLHAARISLSIGLVGVSLSFVVGIVLGGVSGFYGGTADMLIQRVVEFLLSIPKIPFWMALSAALPQAWSPIKVYFGITIILSMMGWCGLARVVRGKILSLREEDFCLAARMAGATDNRIIFKHLLPSFFSYLIISLTLAVPYMILGETALSFLGLGLRPPVVSWGVLLKQAQNVHTVALYPWLLIPAIFVIVTVLCFNFVGDGLRDAADPYK